tara:strand:+ start:937 stop:1125 length:189 start_codon:yes stop_codon:yes gene_type:complete
MNAIQTGAEIRQLVRMLRLKGASDLKSLTVLITEMYLELTEKQKDELFSKVEQGYSSEDLTD